MAEVAKVARRLEAAKESKFLDLSKCGLMKIPDATYLMLKETVVEKCDLSGNHIKRIPSKFFSKFPALSELYLQENNLTSLPDEIRDLEELKVIDLSNNKFEDFPTIVCDCPKLKIVILTDNKIKEVSVDRVRQMSCLSDLDLQDNPLSDDTQSALDNIDLVNISAGMSDPKGKELEELE